MNVDPMHRRSFPMGGVLRFDDDANFVRHDRRSHAPDLTSAIDESL
jgi:hypothetical protein